MSDAALFPRKLSSYFGFFGLLYSILCWIRIQILIRNRNSLRFHQVKKLRLLRFHNKDFGDFFITSSAVREWRLWSRYAHIIRPKTVTVSRDCIFCNLHGCTTTSRMYEEVRTGVADTDPGL